MRARLEIVCTPKAYREFESLLLRQIKPPSFDGGFIFYSAFSANWAFLPLLPQHLSCGEDGVANALRAGTEDLAGLHAL